VIPVGAVASAAARRTTKLPADRLAGSRHRLQLIGALTDRLGERIGPVVSGRRVDAAEDASGHFEMLGPLAGIDNPTSNEQTREILNWEPTHAGLLEDMEEGHYFA
jgi:hypothetical protein